MTPSRDMVGLVKLVERNGMGEGGRELRQGLIVYANNLRSDPTLRVTPSPQVRGNIQGCQRGSQSEDDADLANAISILFPVPLTSPFLRAVYYVKNKRYL